MLAQFAHEMSSNRDHKSRAVRLGDAIAHGVRVPLEGPALLPDVLNGCMSGGRSGVAVEACVCVAALRNGASASGSSPLWLPTALHLAASQVSLSPCPRRHAHTAIPLQAPRTANTSAVPRCSAPLPGRGAPSSAALALSLALARRAACGLRPRADSSQQPDRPPPAPRRPPARAALPCVCVCVLTYVVPP